jgi:hypothetical protein
MVSARPSADYVAPGKNRVFLPNTGNYSAVFTEYLGNRIFGKQLFGRTFGRQDCRSFTTSGANVVSELIQGHLVEGEDSDTFFSLLSSEICN